MSCSPFGGTGRLRARPLRVLVGEADLADLTAHYISIYLSIFLSLYISLSLYIYIYIYI